LAEPIAQIVNSSIKWGCVPRNMKVSVVRPCYKAGSHYVYSNYRPISILPSFDKITESYIAEQLMDYLTEHKLIDANQYGFQQDKSTNLHLERYVNLINNKLNEQMHVISLFIDFSKAFDVINHSKLL
jgi:hypothetical protein